MTLIRNCVGRAVLAAVVGVVTKSLGLDGTVTVALGLVGGLFYFLTGGRGRRPSAVSPAAVRQGQQAIAACARETLAAIDPPLGGDDYGDAFRHLCHAIAEGRTHIRLVAGTRPIEVDLDLS